MFLYAQVICFFFDKKQIAFVCNHSVRYSILRRARSFMKVFAGENICWGCVSWLENPYPKYFVRKKSSMIYQVIVTIL
jgi:hypothetical protein